MQYTPKTDNQKTVETEGVIKFSLEHNHQTLDQGISIAEINAWRSIFVKLQLIGQSPERYQGYGYGNISQRLTNNQNAFVISGTQTGGIDPLQRKQFALVDQAKPQQNYLRSSGLIKPSSEALSHASVYQHCKDAQAVIHVHCPYLWQYAEQLGLPSTAANITYGTAEMAEEVGRLLNTKTLQEKRIFTMRGHEDGVIAYAEKLETAADILINHYARALVLARTFNKNEIID